MRAEFSKSTKLAAFQRANGACEKCTAKLFPSNTEYHHGTECTFGGAAEFHNCVVLCKACHAGITGERAAVIAKSNRIRNAHLGIKPRKSRPMPGSRASGLRKRMNGQVERRT